MTMLLVITQAGDGVMTMHLGIAVNFHCYDQVEVHGIFSRNSLVVST